MSKPEYKPGYWKEHSAAWKSSGLTQQAYCAQQGISYQSFVYQHNRLTIKPQKPAISFVEAKPESHAVSNQAAGLQLMLPNGVRIGITSEINAAFLQTILTIAGGLKC